MATLAVRKQIAMTKNKSEAVQSSDQGVTFSKEMVSENLFEVLTFTAAIVL